ncbi:DMT family transporter [Lederbergia wuyishanensis]|uniref:Drug/metabolite transporter (DMT)-like permease n=1 Tax=Lederbergia wuyishanensis TaxID=1347903 RepID=A0ABU0D7W0_9BACI|nr:DMT family transporter [Lederbergia wuyishanensis]MCJ8009358.1 DMT family transporter [Lederbergia wuyishanensis]MDQ0344507.1 drug/metabolite transporter (DMT)-like permease [Lederbergia wuyishanensis]
MNAKALLMALFTVIIWGSTFAGIRVSLNGGYSPGHLVLVRYFVASALFIVYALWPGVKFRLPQKKDLLKILILGWIGISVYHIGVTFGEQTISAGTAGMLVGSAPIFTAIIAAIVLKERLGLFGWLGLSIGFIGIILITLGTAGSSFTISEGAFFVLISAFATSVFFVFQKPFLTRYKPIELTAYFTWAGTIPFLIFAPGFFQTIQHATLEASLTAIYVGVFPGAIAYVMWAIALSLSKASSITSVLYLEPAIAILVAWMWLQEFPSILSLIGGIVAISGVLIVNIKTRKAKANKVMAKAS